MPAAGGAAGGSETMGALRASIWSVPVTGGRVGGLRAGGGRGRGRLDRYACERHRRDERDDRRGGRGGGRNSGHRRGLDGQRRLNGGRRAPARPAHRRGRPRAPRSRSGHAAPGMSEEEREGRRQPDRRSDRRRIGHGSRPSHGARRSSVVAAAGNMRIAGWAPRSISGRLPGLWRWCGTGRRGGRGQARVRRIHVRKGRTAMPA